MRIVGVILDGGVVAILLLLVLGIGGWVAQSYFEARAFNAATGSHVTTWDAMFLELRVTEGAEGEP